MPVHMTHGRQLPPFGVEGLVGFGMLPAAPSRVGMGILTRSSNPDRLMVSDQIPAAMEPTRQPQYRLQDPRTIDATHILDMGAPQLQQQFTLAPFPFRPTEAPLLHQKTIPLGGRQVLFLPPGPR